MQKHKKLPIHVAIIMDGNGRWAKEKGKNRAFGHKQGVEAVRSTIKHSSNLGIQYLTLFSFSTENWLRPKREVNILMRMFSHLLDSEINELHKNNVKVCFIGRRTKISSILRKKMEKWEEITTNNTGLNLMLAIDYGGRQEIADACRKIVIDNLNPDNVTTDSITKYMYIPNLPDVDLLIRTANEKRISNFLIWQSAYAELYISKVYWPDFNEDEFDRALEEYSQRKRKFGKVI